REQDDLARPPRGSRGRDCGLEVAAADVRDARTVERLRKLFRSLADQVGATVELARELVEALALSRAAEDHVQRDVVRGERAPSRGGVRRLRVVDEAHAPDVGDELETVEH